MKGPYFTISNLLSISRIFLVIPIVLFLKQQTAYGNYFALGLAILACITDFLDGILARKFNEISDLGKILDPLADKIAILIITFLLIFLRDFPAWLFIIIIVRDLAIMAGGLFIVGKQKVILQSNWYGKFTSGALALTIIAYILDFKASYPWFIGISVIMLILSSISYALVFIRKLHEKRTNSQLQPENMVIK
ncbi:CDP-alcohol phosphatidyltransferase family protein [candidate division KSB1 bacterium]|nr:CDP-alcohol phosphatidyltransferase family protein [candidate division KSB1 bacterium]